MEGVRHQAGSSAPVTSSQPASTPQSSQPAPQTAAPNQQQSAPKISDRDAAQRKAEHSLGGVSRRAELQESQQSKSFKQVGGFLLKAKESGLNPQELKRLATHLNSMPEEKRMEEVGFLNRNLFGSFGTPNSANALRAYLDIRDVQQSHPDRISNNVIHTMTMAIANPRSNTRNGLKGIMNHQQALNAAKALSQMPAEHHARFTKLLDQAGTKDGKPVSEAQPHIERSLLLKALGARMNRVSERDQGPLNNSGPTPRDLSYLQQIEKYAGAIRGSSKKQLLSESTGIDIQEGDGKASGLKQVWETCQATSFMISRAETDPIYARSLHRDPKLVSAEQKKMYEDDRGRKVNDRIPPLAIEGNEADKWLKPHTGLNYDYRFIQNSDERRKGLADLERAVRRGSDVNIGVHLESGTRHALVVNDVRGTGDQRHFLITNPGTGISKWYSYDELLSGKTKLDNDYGRGKIDSMYLPTGEASAKRPPDSPPPEVSPLFRDPS